MNSDNLNQESDNDIAVLVKNCSKSYLQGRKSVSILNELNLSVRRGSIYGLLGPSGCGKTTLLRCILGRLSPDRGQVLVFGHCPGTKESGIPGPKVGYMPQENALFDTLTIGETLSYYGSVLGLSNAYVKSRITYFVDLLKLPSPSTQNNTLSGGQLRRVSFAVTIIHDPQLIILDEPTVGVDPIVRQSMWDYLFNMVATRGCSIILTTHYIDEARNVDAVGMMQDGRLLVEDSPKALIGRFGCTTLEEVFFSVCMQSQEYEHEFDDESDPLIIMNRQGITPSPVSYAAPLTEVRVQDVCQKNDLTLDKQIDTKIEKGGQYHENLRRSDFLNKSVDVSKDDTLKTLCKTNSDESCSSDYKSSCADEEIESVKWEKNSPVNHATHMKKIKTIIKKNAISMYRFPGALAYFFVYPAIQLLVCGWALGGAIHDIHIGVLNRDTGHLGRQFLNHCNPDLIIQEPFNNFEDGYQSILDGNTFALIQIKENFTNSFVDRFKNAPMNSNLTLEQSIIDVALDDSHFQISKTLHFEFLDAFQSFSRSALEDAGLNPLLAQLPIGTNDNVFGWLDQPFRTYLMPGLLFLISYFAPMPVALMSIFMEKITGNLERSYIAGVGSFEIVMGFMALQICIVFSQLFMVAVAAFVVFATPMHGSYVLFVVLSVASSMSGMVLGVFMSAMYNSVINLCVWAFFSVFSSLTVSGLFWPIDAMPYFFQIVCMLSPYYYPVQAMYGILYKGWGISHIVVLLGFASTFAWFLIYFVASLVTFRYKRYSTV